MKEKYTHQSEEISKAEEMMTLEQKAASKNRERFKFQERPQFLDESVTEQDEGDVRRMPSPEERESMDSNVKKLGKIFDSSDVYILDWENWTGVLDRKRGYNSVRKESDKV